MTDLHQHTVFADALAADEQAFDRLVEAAPAYKKFAKVLMREDTAGRLTLADVAHMAGLPVNAVVETATGTGTPTLAAGQPPSEETPSWAEDLDPVQWAFDARPLLIDGHEPLPAILDFVAGVPAGMPFAVDATFHPIPLRRLFEGRGYDTAVRCLAPDHWRILAVPRA